MRWVLGIIFVSAIGFLMKDLVSWSVEESPAPDKWAGENTASETLSEDFSKGPSTVDSKKSLSEEVSSHASSPELTAEDLQQLIAAWQSDAPLSNEAVAIGGKSLESIQLELQNLPHGPDSAAARSFLLNAAAQLSIDNDDAADQVHELALRELFESPDALAEPQKVAGLESFSNFLPVVAHEVAIKTAVDVETAMQVTLESIQLYKDPQVRSTFIQHFNRYFPEDQERLVNAIADRPSEPEGL